MTGSWPHMAQLEANGELHLTKPFKLKGFTSQVMQRIGPGDGHNWEKADWVVPTARVRPANSAIWLERHMNNTWFVPPIVIPIGFALALLCYVSALYVL
jgi:hypothetical protein